MATKEEIWAAADAIEEAGGRPTLANVREHLGGGSYTDISQHMQTWRARQQALAMPLREPAPAAITERLGKLAADLWAVALDLANSRLQAEREALNAARQDAERTRQEAADLADQLAGDLDRARAEIEHLGQRVAALTQEAGNLSGDLQEQAAARAAAEYRADLAEASTTALQDQAAQLAALLDREQAARAEADGRARRAGEEVAELRGRLAALSPQTPVSLVSPKPVKLKPAAKAHKTPS